MIEIKRVEFDGERLKITKGDQIILNSKTRLYVRSFYLYTIRFTYPKGF